MRRYHITQNDAGQRADRFLRKAAPDIPASLLQKTFRLRDVKCGGKRVSADYILQAGEELLAYFPDTLPPVVETTRSPLLYTEGDINAFRVLYEDEHVLVTHKPAGLPTQADDARGADSLERQFRSYLCRSGCWTPGQEHFMPSVCHRLDRQTEGLLLCAKSAEALRALSEKIRKGEVEKCYHALVWGAVAPPAGIWRDYLFKDPDASFVTVHRDRAQGAKSASLSYRSVRTLTARADGREALATLLEINLHTGRTHQIRVQAASRGHPVVGDTKYGGAGRQKKAPDRFALCALRLGLNFSANSGALAGIAGRSFATEADFSAFLAKPDK